MIFDIILYNACLFLGKYLDHGQALRPEDSFFKKKNAKV